MGPVTLFDKSFLQALSIDESVWFDNFFQALIAPVFYIETLSDLAKGNSKRASAETEVRFIASKFPERSGTPCVNYLDLCINDLLGNQVPMRGAIPIAGHEVKSSDGKIGFVHDRSPEADAFGRWEREEFLSIERLYAKEWRKKLNAINLNEISDSLKTIGINSKSFRNLAEVKTVADEVVNTRDRNSERLNLMNHFFNIPYQYRSEVFRRWADSGYPTLSNFAPYAAFVLNIELFFHLALAAHLISTQRNSNRTDIVYLFYLPFCKIFVSGDKLHRKCAPLFMRKDQEFIWGFDLKTDLKNINQYYEKMPEDVKKQGVMKFAVEPPIDGDFLITRIWKKYNLIHSDPIVLTEKQERDIGKKVIEETIGSATTIQGVYPPTPMDFISLKRSIKKCKGNWYQLPENYSVT